MKTLKTLANIAILSPLTVLLVFVTALAWAFRSQGAGGSESWGAAMGFALAIYFIGIGSGVAFLVGLALHGFIAVRLQHSYRWAWWYCLTVSLAFMTLVRPIGTTIGAIVVFLLLWWQPFRIMRKGVEQCHGP
jgi:hypothetical protein